jgi:hypothetical protein
MLTFKTSLSSNLGPLLFPLHFYLYALISVEGIEDPGDEIGC